MIVGLLGFIGSGKGTAGDVLRDNGFVPISFASGVKDVAAEMFGWPRHLLEGNTEESREWREQPDSFWSKEFGRQFTPRLALQLMGTEVGRDIFHQDFWVIKLKQTILKNRNANYVITDVRFRNEMNFIHDNNGILIEIKRGITPPWYTIAEKSNSGDEKALEFMLNQSGVHESEWRWIGGDIDHTVENEGTLEDLKTNLLKCLTKSYGANIMNNLNEGVL